MWEEEGSFLPTKAKLIVLSPPELSSIHQSHTSSLTHLFNIFLSLNKKQQLLNPKTPLYAVFLLNDSVPVFEDMDSGG